MNPNIDDNSNFNTTEEENMLNIRNGMCISRKLSNESFASNQTEEEAKSQIDDINNHYIKVDSKDESIIKAKIERFEVVNQDKYLTNYECYIAKRVNKFNELLKLFTDNEESLLNFSKGYEKMGLQVKSDEIQFKEYAPAAEELTIV